MLAFVYGTLTDPNRVRAVVGPDGWTFVGEAAIDGLRRVEGEYPTLAPGGSVDGRLLELEDEAAIDALDAYEGVDRGLYVRVELPIAAGDEPELRRRGETPPPTGDRTAWTYVGNPDRLGVEEAIDWTAIDGEERPTVISFERAVRQYVSRRRPVVRSHE